MLHLFLHLWTSLACENLNSIFAQIFYIEDTHRERENALTPTFCQVFDQQHCMPLRAVNTH